MKKRLTKSIAIILCAAILLCVVIILGISSGKKTNLNADNSANSLEIKTENEENNSNNNNNSSMNFSNDDSESKDNSVYETPDESISSNASAEDNDLTNESSSIPHKHSYTSLRTEATCEGDGSIKYICSCGYSYKETIKCVGHSWGEWETKRNATTSQTGLQTRICSKCGKTEEKTIPKEEVKVSPKLTADNINDIEEIDIFAKSPNTHVYNYKGEALYLSIGYQHNGEVYYCSLEEYRMFICLLNINYMADATIKEMFGEMTKEDIKRCSNVFRSLSHAFIQKDLVFRYDDFIVDNNTRLFLNELQTQIIKYKNDGNIEEYNKFVEEYFNGNNRYIEYGENAIIDNFVYSLTGKTISLYDNIYLDFVVSQNSRSSSRYHSYIEEDFYNITI